MQGIVSAESLVEASKKQVPLPHIKSDNEYVDEIERHVPADKLLELGTDNVRQLIEMMREKDQAAYIATENWKFHESCVESMQPELERLRKLARDLAERVGRTYSEENGNHLAADFDQDLLYDILDCGEELLVRDYAQQLREGEKPPEVVEPPPTFELTQQSGSMAQFKVKVDLIGQQEAIRQKLKYQGAQFIRDQGILGLCVRLDFQAKPGQQLDRLRLKQLLDRHKPVGMSIEMLANVHVGVPL